MTVEGAGRVVLVTGGTRGIGLAVARTMASGGARVAVTTRRPVTTTDGLGGSDGPLADLLVVPCDVTDDRSVDEAFAAVEARWGPPEVVVSNAGVTADGLAVRLGTADFVGVLDTNLTGSFRVARRALPRMMRARWGRIVLIGSVVGSVGQTGQANYAAAKAGLVGLARSLAREYASRGITVNVVAPGPIDTDMLAAVGPAHRDAIVGTVPLGRVGSPAEVAAAVAFLASDAAGYTTGAVLPVDGGLGMGAT